jgi:hypothetical protein
MAVFSYTWHFTSLGIQSRISASWNEYTNISGGSTPYVYITVNGHAITVGHESWHCVHDELYNLLFEKVGDCKAESIRKAELAHQTKLRKTLELTKAIAKTYKVKIEESEDNNSRKITIPSEEAKQEA